MCDDDKRFKRKNLWKSVRKHINTRNYELSSYKVVEDLNKVDENMCVKLDLENQRIYRKLKEKAMKVRDSVSSNSYLTLSVNIDEPPKPSNLERFKLWIKRNTKISVIPQTQAVIFLENMGYKLDIDYEAYQAINLADEVKQSEGIVETDLDKTQDFDELYTDKDTNLFRNRSLYGKEIEPSFERNRNRIQNIENQELTPVSDNSPRQHIIRRHTLPIPVSRNNFLTNTPNNSPSNQPDMVENNLYPDLSEFQNTPPDYSSINNNLNNLNQTNNSSGVPTAPFPPDNFNFVDNVSLQRSNCRNNINRPNQNKKLELYPGCDSDSD